MSLSCYIISLSFYFFFNYTSPTDIYTLSLHDALPIWSLPTSPAHALWRGPVSWELWSAATVRGHKARQKRSEEHTSELQSHHDLVCRLLLEKKKKTILNIVQLKHKRISIQVV